VLAAKGRFMPIWSYFYLACLLASSLYLVVSVKPISFARVCGEMASVFSYVAIFVISYEQINVIEPFPLSTLLLLYTLLWGVFGYKEHYSFYWMPATEFAKTVELGKDESFEDAVLSIKLIKSASIVLIVLLVSPLFYVYSRMF
tara:strand:+ start:512 stop:943 length:432 start_codon:yes stop_codon:yes gene_type:complete